MKKTMKLFWLVAAFAVVFSCSKESDQNALENNSSEETTPEVVAPAEDGNLLTSFSVSFEKDAEDPDSRVSVNLGTGETDIEENDEVLVYVDDSNKAIYKYNGTKFVLKSGEKAVALDAPASVFYPASEFDEGTAAFTMPAAVTSLSDLGDKAPMAGRISGSAGSYTVVLKNLASVLKVSVTGASTNTLTTLTLDAAGKSVAAGATYTVDFSGERPVLATGAGDAASSMVINAGGVSLSSVAQTFYFIVPGGLSLGNVTVTATLGENHNGGTNTFSLGKASFTPAANTMIGMSFYAGLFSGGAGVDGDPYLIANARDFKNLQKYTVEGYTPGSKTAASFLSAYYKQTVDIDFKNASLTPIGIGGGASAFSGTYDGNGKQLQNVSINVDTQFAAPFGYVNNGTIKNLTVSGIITKTGDTGNSLSGGIAGILNGAAQITGCTNQATITSTATYTGGIAGRLYGTSASISNSHNSGSVTGVSYVGGIVGDEEGGKVYACENRGNVTASSSEAGGIAGRFQGGTIKACYSANGALISGASRIGGIAGYQSNQGTGASLIINCASKSQIKSTGDGNNGAAGGLVGYMYSAADKGDVVLTNSVALGNGVFNTNQEDSYLGAIVGQVNGAATFRRYT